MSGGSRSLSAAEQGLLSDHRSRLSLSTLTLALGGHTLDPPFPFPLEQELVTEYPGLKKELAKPVALAVADFDARVPTTTNPNSTTSGSARTFCRLRTTLRYQIPRDLGNLYGLFAGGGRWLSTLRVDLL